MTAFPCGPCTFNEGVVAEYSCDVGCVGCTRQEAKLTRNRGLPPLSEKKTRHRAVLKYLIQKMHVNGLVTWQPFSYITNRGSLSSPPTCKTSCQRDFVSWNSHYPLAPVDRPHQ